MRDDDPVGRERHGEVRVAQERADGRIHRAEHDEQHRQRDRERLRRVPRTHADTEQDEQDDETRLRDERTTRQRLGGEDAVRGHPDDGALRVRCDSYAIRREGFGQRATEVVDDARDDTVNESTTQRCTGPRCPRRGGVLPDARGLAGGMRLVLGCIAGVGGSLLATSAEAGGCPGRAALAGGFT